MALGHRVVVVGEVRGLGSIAVAFPADSLEEEVAAASTSALAVAAVAEEEIRLTCSKSSLEAEEAVVVDLAEVLAAVRGSSAAGQGAVSASSAAGQGAVSASSSSSGARLSSIRGTRL